MENQTSKESAQNKYGEPAIRVTMLPRDTNKHGTVFGGVILSHLDLAGDIEARRNASRNFVTVALRGVEFIAPVFVGDLVSFYTRTVKTGRTSVTVEVIVEAERDDDPRDCVRVMEAEVVYVAVDENRRPVPISG
ncbi:MAG: hotdog domain-containing protein [Blastocatellia bacterium]